ncbi:ChaC-like protein [Bimuria novae-zelandiae CBS 107.79]|uniref:glutathione-specific gamma-glutamylcyclotransferase n=1 Tax=Bimuria novae-zelandiae CBS 107.79 TaxID=1447943 RepID=A0A6A5VPP8_9PLEO|nr:ChaC-like protein [Bimuria novae-zelandiae CBS 107.79]
MTDHSRQIEDFGKNDDFWLFGYGSLIWKPPPHFDQRVPGYIEGYVRRFWQASEDHRGTPEAPGRVATLIDRAHWDTLTDHHGATERVWGAAYHIPMPYVAAVREYLDIREINGYSIQFTPFVPSSTSTSPTSDPIPKTINTLVYIGLPSNPQFLGPQDPDALARHILKSRGPSGENREYLFQLEEALGALGNESGDAHVSDLVRRCREIEAEGGGEEGASLEAFHKIGSTDEQEEVEK